MKKSEAKKSSGSGGEKKRLIAQLKEAEKHAETAGHLARLAKKKFKEARKSFKVAKKAAKRARKKVREFQKALQAASKRKTAKAKRNTKTTKKPSKRPVTARAGKSSKSPKKRRLAAPAIARADAVHEIHSEERPANPPVS